MKVFTNLIFLGGLIIYLAICGLAYLLQDKLLFHPTSERTTPVIPLISEHELTTPDGETLVAWYSEAEAGCPTMLFMHGNGGRIDMGIYRYRRLQAKGVGFLALSWRGYSGSTGRPSEAGFHIDAQTAWEWLTTIQSIPAQDIVIHGHSIGSGPAVKLASQITPGALILEAPFYSMLDLVQRKMRLLPAQILLRNRFRSDLWIADVTAPTFIAHGDLDQIIPAEQSARLQTLSTAPNVRHVMENGDHNTLVRDGIYDLIWPFLAQNWQHSSGQLCPELGTSS